MQHEGKLASLELINGLAVGHNEDQYGLVSEVILRPINEIQNVMDKLVVHLQLDETKGRTVFFDCLFRLLVWLCDLLFGPLALVSLALTLISGAQLLVHLPVVFNDNLLD